MKSRLSNQAIILTVLALSCGAITEVRAGRIDFTNFTTVSSCDGTATSHLTGELSKEFKGICSTDIVFTVHDNSDIRLENFEEMVLNSTRQTWTDFHMRLGFGTGSLFQPISAGCVSFNQPEKATSTPFKREGTNPMGIDWGGGPTLSDGNRGSFTFVLNVPDFAQCKTAPVVSRGYQFTLRETPTTVPEPATMLLLSTGLAGVAIKMRKRLKSGKSKRES